MTKRKILVFSRHGKAPQRKDMSSIDSLVPETVAATLIGTAHRIERCDDIGGGFAMAQGAQLVIDKTPTGLYTARVERNGQRYNVNLDRLR